MAQGPVAESLWQVPFRWEHPLRLKPVTKSAPLTGQWHPGTGQHRRRAGDETRGAWTQKMAVCRF